jgi:hypothetical protein
MEERKKAGLKIKVVSGKRMFTHRLSVDVSAALLIFGPVTSSVVAS